MLKKLKFFNKNGINEVFATGISMQKTSTLKKAVKEACP